VPVVVHTHGTALRQRTLCPDVVPEIRDGIRAVDRLLALHEGHAAAYAEAFEVPRARTRVVGTGYRSEIFHARGRTGDGSDALLYAGKLSASKGVPELLEAFARVRTERPAATLHLVGGGAGPEAESIRERAAATPGVVVHGRLDQERLAALARRCAVFVLPSFWEGLPLVLAEALACGCRLVATALPGVVEGLAPRLGSALETVPVPRMAEIDVPLDEDRPGFARDLAEAVRRALEAPPPDPTLARPFTWDTVLDRIEAVWRELIPDIFEENRT
jgi:glycosyltransferase involved in cell wall biosynthesis